MEQTSRASAGRPAGRHVEQVAKVLSDSRPVGVERAMLQHSFTTISTWWQVLGELVRAVSG